MAKNVNPKKILTRSTLTTDRFVNSLGGSKGSLANLISTTVSRATNTPVKTNGVYMEWKKENELSLLYIGANRSIRTITAADLQGNVWPPKFIAKRKSVAAAKTRKLPSFHSECHPSVYSPTYPFIIITCIVNSLQLYSKILLLCWQMQKDDKDHHSNTANR